MVDIDERSGIRAAGLRVTEPAIAPPRAPAVGADRHHHHLVCRSCGVIVEVACAVGGVPCLPPSRSSGFIVDEAEVVFRGICHDCRERSAS